MNENPIIIALDNLPVEWALALVEKIIRERRETEKDLIWGFKLSGMITLDGIHICRFLKRKGFNVMADMKFYDLPNIMVSHVRTLHDNSSCDIITVHMAARFNDDEVDSSYLAGVSVLTSMNNSDCEKIRGSSIEEVMLCDAAFAEENKYGYFVCSGDELNLLKEFKFKKIVPGIRPKWSSIKNDNQVRQTTPMEALKNGANLLVIGRPVIQTKDPIDNILRINEELGLM